MTDTVIDDPMLDEDWLAAPAKRSRLRAALTVILAAALCFLGGAMVQKHFGASSAAETTAGGQLPAGLPGGIPEGGIPGGAPGASDGAAESAAGADDTGSVIGEVVEVRDEVWIVEDLGGKRHQVKVGDDTEVVRETSIQLSEVKVGDPVDVSGTTSNGRLQADEVTLR